MSYDNEGEGTILFKHIQTNGIRNINIRGTWNQGKLSRKWGHGRGNIQILDPSETGNSLRGDTISDSNPNQTVYSLCLNCAVRKMENALQRTKRGRSRSCLQGLTVERAELGT